MPSIRITQFAGITPELAARNLNKVNAQVAHNCLLWDGTLRPMPKWALFMRTSIASDTNHIHEDTRTGNLVEAFSFSDAVYLNGPPFANRMLVGVDNEFTNVAGYESNLAMTENLNVVRTSYPLGLPTPTFGSSF